VPLTHPGLAMDFEWDSAKDVSRDLGSIRRSRQSALTEEERHQAALLDSDAPPATKAQLARARGVPTVRALREKLNLTQEAAAAGASSWLAISRPFPVIGIFVAVPLLTARSSAWRMCGRASARP
jgi:hypothetical protein